MDLDDQWVAVRCAVTHGGTIAVHPPTSTSEHWADNTVRVSMFRRSTGGFMVRMNRHGGVRVQLEGTGPHFIRAVEESYLALHESERALS